MYIVAIDKIADSHQIIAFIKLFVLHYSIIRPIGLSVEFCCMSNVNIIVDTKLQPNTYLCIV